MSYENWKNKAQGFRSEERRVGKECLVLPCGEEGRRRLRSFQATGSFELSHDR